MHEQSHRPTTVWNRWKGEANNCSSSQYKTIFTFFFFHFLRRITMYFNMRSTTTNEAASIRIHQHSISFRIVWITVYYKVNKIVFNVKFIAFKFKKNKNKQKKNQWCITIEHRKSHTTIPLQRIVLWFTVLTLILCSPNILCIICLLVCCLFLLFINILSFGSSMLDNGGYEGEKWPEINKKMKLKV